MRNYSYQNKWQKLLTPEVVSLLTQIHEFKGEQTLFIEAKTDTLTQLVEIAKIQSTEASNKIEGIYTSDERLKSLVSNKTTPRTRNEQEIAGYRDVLSTIHESHDYIPVKPAIILQLHRDLYKFSGKSIGGSYKTSDNVIAEEDSEGNRLFVFSLFPHGKQRIPWKFFAVHSMKYSHKETPILFSSSQCLYLTFSVSTRSTMGTVECQGF